MITDERLAEALACFRGGGTLLERRQDARAVILNAVDDMPVELTDEDEDAKGSFWDNERLTESEAAELASLVEFSIHHIRCDKDILEVFWREIQSSDSKELVVHQFQEHSQLPLRACEVLYDMFTEIRDTAEIAVETKWHGELKATIEKLNAEWQSQLDNAWNQGEIQRQSKDSWKKRAGRLGKSLLRLAQAPVICDHCAQVIGAPFPYSEEELIHVMGGPRIHSRPGTDSRIDPRKPPIVSPSQTQVSGKEQEITPDMENNIEETGE